MDNIQDLPQIFEKIVRIYFTNKKCIWFKEFACIWFKEIATKTN